MPRSIIREAVYSDIPELHRLFQEALERSVYRDVAAIEYDVATQSIVQVIYGHGPADTNANVCFVAEDPETQNLTGVIVGGIRPVYQILTVDMAQEMLWYSSKEAQARDAARLMLSFRKWAKTAPKGVIFRHSVVDYISNTDVTSRYLKRQGFRPVGIIMEEDHLK